MSKRITTLQVPTLLLNKDNYAVTVKFTNKMGKYYGKGAEMLTIPILYGDSVLEELLVHPLFQLGNLTICIDLNKCIQLNMYYDTIDPTGKIMILHTNHLIALSQSYTGCSTEQLEFII